MYLMFGFMHLTEEKKVKQYTYTHTHKFPKEETIQCGFLIELLNFTMKPILFYLGISPQSRSLI